MSISSSEGSPLPVDLPTKYQKLAAEYAKVRAQVNVLKKAVLDEQTRSSELKEYLKTKDQTLRKHDQELDSLNFRNQQLTKRVTVLQEELEKHQTIKKGRTRLESNITDEESKLFQEELQNRILENARLLSLLEDTNQEHEKERQQWNEAKRALERSVLDVSGARCECEALRSKVTSLEAALREKGKTHLRKEVEIRRSHQPWPLLKKLPIMEVISSVQCVVVASGVSSSTSKSVRKLHEAFTASSQDLLLSALQDHLAELAMTGVHIGDSNKTVKQFLTLLCELETEIIHCLDANALVPSSVHDSLGAIGEVVRSLRSAAVYHSSLLRDGGESALPGALSDLAGVQDACGTLWKAISELQIRLNQDDEPESEKSAQLPCRQCRKFCRHYEEKIEALEKRISRISLAAENNLRELNGPVPDHDIPAGPVVAELQHITTEFGDANVVAESVWRSSSVEEELKIRCNAAIVDRQLAESKLTRVMTECDAARFRLEQCLEELREQSCLVTRLQEELSVTTRSYEDQLSSMSEHMANMNDKLAAQETMIEDLTYELATKDNKKGRSK